MTLTVINDTHCGAIRTGGTTPVTQTQLRQATLHGLIALLEQCEGDVLINGDLFDAFMIPFMDLWLTVEACSAYLEDEKDATLYVGRGNHDIAKNSLNMSSFDLFCKIMESRWGLRFVPITEPAFLAKHLAYVIPHLPNQDLFNEALKQVPKTKFLFVHANFDNKFAVEADHSLNVSVEQAEAAPVDFVVFGHEHQRKSALNGKVVIVGNQIPTSVADCLGNDVKYLLRIHDSKIEHLPVWQAEGDFARPDWRELEAALALPARFIRVQGEATAAEAADVIGRISKFRTKSKALVITNAVSIDGVASDDEIKMTLEGVKQFDVLTALLELLDEGWERNTVTSLVKQHNVQTNQAE